MDEARLLDQGEPAEISKLDRSAVAPGRAIDRDRKRRRRAGHHIGGPRRWGDEDQEGDQESARHGESQYLVSKVAVTSVLPSAGMLTLHSAASALVRWLARLSAAILVSPHRPSWIRRTVTGLGRALVRV